MEVTKKKQSRKNGLGSSTVATRANDKELAKANTQHLQEETIELDVQIRKIEIPKNQSEEVITKLRKINHLIARAKHLKDLMNDLNTQRSKVVKIINRDIQKRKNRSLLQFKLEKMKLLKTARPDSNTIQTP